MFTQKPISTIGKQIIPRPLGLATYCALADSSIVLRMGGSRCRKIHAEEYVSDVVVEDRRCVILVQPSWERFDLT